MISYHEDVFDPIPYLGYEIQPHPDGFYYVIVQGGRSKPSMVKFPSIDGAQMYIDNLASGGIYGGGQ